MLNICMNAQNAVYLNYSTENRSSAFSKRIFYVQYPLDWSFNDASHDVIIFHKESIRSIYVLFRSQAIRLNSVFSIIILKASSLNFNKRNSVNY